jgi:hypothetical protein
MELVLALALASLLLPEALGAATAYWLEDSWPRW